MAVNYATRVKRDSYKDWASDYPLLKPLPRRTFNTLDGGRTLSETVIPSRCIKDRSAIEIGINSTFDLVIVDQIVESSPFSARPNHSKEWQQAIQLLVEQELRSPSRPFDSLIELRNYFCKTISLKSAKQDLIATVPSDKSDTAAFDWMREAAKLEEIGLVDQALDVIYKNIDGLMRESRFSSIGRLLSEVDAPATSTDLLLGLLTATLPARSRIRSRSAFLQKVDEAIRDRGDYEEGLLSGL